MASAVSTENNVSNLIAYINITDSDSIFANMGDYCQKQISIEVNQYYSIDSDGIDHTDEKTQIQTRINEYTKLITQYYLMAIEEGSVNAMNKLGRFYKEQSMYGPNTIQSTKLMAKYYLMAIQNGSSYAMRKMGHYYSDEENYDLMKYFYELAFSHGDIKVAFYLGDYYQHIEPNKSLMKKYYLIAIENMTTFSPDNYRSINYIQPIATEKECIVCYEIKKMYATPCQRHSICIDCSIELINQPCPMCRGTNN